jgi:hypothetical protein
MKSRPTDITFNETDWRRFVATCERQRLTSRPISHEEVCRVDAVTIGEHFNFDLIRLLIGDSLTDDYRARLGF